MLLAHRLAQILQPIDAALPTHTQARGNLDGHRRLRFGANLQPIGQRRRKAEEEIDQMRQAVALSKDNHFMAMKLT